MSVQLNDIEFQVKKYEDLLLLQSGTAGSISLPQMARKILDSDIPAIINVIATEKEICIQCEESFVDIIFERISTFNFEQLAPKEKQYFLPVYFYENEDTKHIEDTSNMSFETYIHAILEREYTLSMFGFVPGFLYLRALADNLAIPRKSNPSTQIEAGSIAVGGHFLGLYSLSTPAGWHVLGKTPLTVLDLPNTPPILLEPGDRIVLKRIDANEFKVLQALSQNILEYND